MTIKLIKRPPTGAELRLDGRLDTNSAPAAQDTFLKLAEEYKQLELNLEKLAYISSAGLRSLLMLQKHMIKQGGSLTISHVTPTVLEVFEMTGFSGILHIEE